MMTHPPGRPLWMKPSLAAVGAVASAVILSVAIGFVLLPLLQPNGENLSVWQRICHAAGLSPPRMEAEAPAPTQTTSRVVVVPGMLVGQSPAAVGQGATLALQCSSCHGARGLSGAGVPNLAGQYAVVIYKQLLDYASGARKNAVMSPRVASLTDGDMRDLAAFYAYLPRPPVTHDAAGAPAPQIVASGSPMRNVAPCGACHGSPAYKAGSPWLDGEPPAYLRAQLTAFASGTRHNDISGQMRNVARGMSPAEIESAAAYYGGPR
jgi:cytochrome c553